MTAAVLARLSTVLGATRIEADDRLVDVSQKLRKRVELATLHRDELRLRLGRSSVRLEALQLQHSRQQEKLLLTQQEQAKVRDEAEEALRREIKEREARCGTLRSTINEQQLKYESSIANLSALKADAMQRFGRLQQSIDALQTRCGATEGLSTQVQKLQADINQKRSSLERLRNESRRYTDHTRAVALMLADMLGIGGEVRQQLGLNIDGFNVPYYASRSHYEWNVNTEDVYDNRWAALAAQYKKHDKEVQSNFTQKTIGAQQSMVDQDGEELAPETMRSNIQKYYETVDRATETCWSQLRQSRLARTEPPAAPPEPEVVRACRGSRNVARVDIQNEPPEKDDYYDNVAREQKRVMSLYETFYYPQSQAERRRARERERVAGRMRQLSTEYEHLRAQQLGSALRGDKRGVKAYGERAATRLLQLQELEKTSRKCKGRK